MWMLGMKHSRATVRKVPVTMAPSWSVYLLPVCLGVMSARQTDWEHICTPHSSTEASPDTEEQAGLLAAPASVPSFQLCSKPVAEPCSGRGRAQAGKCSAHRTWQLSAGQGSQAEFTCAPLRLPRCHQSWHSVALPSTWPH